MAEGGRYEIKDGKRVRVEEPTAERPAGNAPAGPGAAKAPPKAAPAKPDTAGAAGPTDAE